MKRLMLQLAVLAMVAGTAHANPTPLSDAAMNRITAGDSSGNNNGNGNIGSNNGNGNLGNGNGNGNLGDNLGNGSLGGLPASGEAAATVRPSATVNPTGIRRFHWPHAPGSWRLHAGQWPASGWSSWSGTLQSGSLRSAAH